MTIEQQFSIWFIRIALVLWFWFAWLRLQPIHKQRLIDLRWLWTLATACYVIHMVSAFGAFHAWSHAAAVEHTAAQTLERVGLDWGGGIYFNHAFTLVCIVESVWWWVNPSSLMTRPRWQNLVIYLFVVFILINAAVIFVSGPVRWLSTAAMLLLMARFFLKNRIQRNHQTAG